MKKIIELNHREINIVTGGCEISPILYFTASFAITATITSTYFIMQHKYLSHYIKNHIQHNHVYLRIGQKIAGLIQDKNIEEIAEQFFAPRITTLIRNVKIPDDMGGYFYRGNGF